MLVIKRLGDDGVKAIIGAKTEEITNKGVTVKSVDGTRFIETDTVVLAIGEKPNPELYSKLNGKVSDLYIIGDCLKPGKLMDSIHQGAYVGLQV
jgi:NADH dehydrogenase FAD-containing subunit